jgi:hypothetical protein
MKFKGETYNRVCYVGSIYALLVYLSYSSMEEIKRTLFIFGHGIPHDIANRLSGQMIFIDQFEIANPFAKFLMKRFSTAWVYLRYLNWKLIPKFDGNEEIYAQDFHLLSPYVCGRNYTLIEDGPGFFMNAQNINHGFVKEKAFRKTKRYKFYQLLYGKNYDCIHGDSPFCKTIIVTKKEDAQYLQDIPKIIFDINTCWAKFSEGKRRFIFYIYNIKGPDLESLRSHNIIFFTQPFYPTMLDYDEYVNICSRILAKYPQNKLLIKVHQADVIEYEKLYPYIPVFRKKVPSQLFDMIGVKYHKVITISSASVCNYDYPVEIDWYGFNVSTKLMKKFGDIEMPNGAHKCYL